MGSFRLGITQRRWGFIGGRRPGCWIAAAAVALAPFAAAWRAEAAGRVALVMVGEDYQKFEKSGIGVERANDIVKALQAKDFNVVLSANPVNARARAILLDFSQKANGSDLAVAFLIGHVTAMGGESYFLPVNTELRVAADLFSRGISVSSVARIVGKAKAGAVIVLMTTPNFGTEVPGVDPRPQYAAENPKSVVTVFSSSARMPVSRIDAVTEKAANTVVNLLQQPAPSLTEVVKTVSPDVSAVFGAAADVSLAKSAPATEIVVGATEQTPGEQAPPKSVAVTAAPSHTIAAEPLDESQLGKRQRERIQERLRDMSFYTGPIDSVMGRLTREAIMGYQRSKGAQVTGYLTPEQFLSLLPGGD